VTARRRLLVLTAAVLIAAGCGGGSNTPGSPSTVNPSEMPNVQHAPERLVIDVIVEGDNVTPTNAELRAKTKQPIIIRINSDTADQLHVHSNPEHNFTVEPRSGQSFQFTVDVPGQVEVELHELSRTVATIHVR
jgi:hypothetical protein